MIRVAIVQVSWYSYDLFMCFSLHDVDYGIEKVKLISTHIPWKQIFKYPVYMLIDVLNVAVSIILSHSLSKVNLVLQNLYCPAY